MRQSDICFFFVQSHWRRTKEGTTVLKRVVSGYYVFVTGQLTKKEHRVS